MEQNIWPNVNGMMNGGLNIPPNGLMPFLMNGNMNAPMNDLMNEAMKDPEAEKNREMMNRERIRKAILDSVVKVYLTT